MAMPEVRGGEEVAVEERWRGHHRGEERCGEGRAGSGGGEREGVWSEEGEGEGGAGGGEGESAESSRVQQPQHGDLKHRSWLVSLSHPQPFSPDF